MSDLAKFLKINQWFFDLLGLLNFEKFSYLFDKLESWQKSDIKVR